MRRIVLLACVAGLLATAGFSTAPASAASPAGRPAEWNQIMGAGDIAPGPDVQQFNDVATSDLLVSAKPATVFTAGDDQYPTGDYADFQSPDGYQGSWGRLKSITCAAVGNHEYSDEGAGPPGYNAYFNPQCPHRPDTEYATYTRPDGTRGTIKTAFAFRPAPGSGWWAYVLDSQCNHQPERGPSCARYGNMLNWFRAHMAAHPAKCRLAIWHHPRFGSWKNPSDEQVYWLYAVAASGGRVSLIINGHSHWYERFTSQKWDGGVDTTYTAPRTIVVGTGGIGLIPFDYAPLSSSRYRDDKHFGVERITLGNGYWTAEFDRTDGQVADVVSAPC